ncbi:hypothetical protein Cl131_gp095 [Aphanizomenon phage vB_AphaS-CL131]|nr:hypothetical protein Cl131_gp095 [Aphanizomenon phage vB_AphaS-CL131]
MSAITPGAEHRFVASGQIFVFNGVKYKVLRQYKFYSSFWSCLYFKPKGNSGHNRIFSEQEILEALNS